MTKIANSLIVLLAAASTPRAPVRLGVCANDGHIADIVVALFKDSRCRTSVAGFLGITTLVIDILTYTLIDLR